LGHAKPFVATWLESGLIETTRSSLAAISKPHSDSQIRQKVLCVLAMRGLVYVVRVRLRGWQLRRVFESPGLTAYPAFARSYEFKPVFEDYVQAGNT